MDIRAYLQWRIETHQAAKERARKCAEKICYVLAMVAMAALWLTAWMMG
jgi:hypothetical protein